MNAADTVRRSSLVHLIDALNDDVFGRFTDADGQEYFRCPRCGDRDSRANCGRALTTSDDRWHCTTCRTFGTRFELERMVLEDAIALDRLLFAIAIDGET